jgi:CheY-like chemotaxis protein
MSNSLLRPVLGTLLALVLAGCEHLHTGATSAKVEAKAVVRAVYEQVPDAALKDLPYAGVDGPRTVRRIRDRFPQIRPFLERGVVGITADGLLGLRDAAGLAPEERTGIERLVRDENRDRLLLYRTVSDQTGHPDESDWMSYVSENFATEWIGQAPGGWWHQDPRRHWTQKPPASSAR